jgi:transposase
LKERAKEWAKMHSKSLIKRLLKIDKITVANVYFETVNEEEMLIVRAGPLIRDSLRCPHCGKRCNGYDSSGKIRRWRSLDFGSTRVYIEAAAPRIQCPEHGVVVAKVPWARRDSDYTNDFEAAVTWLTLHATIQDVADFFRIKWDTVGSIARRVQGSLEKERPSRFDNLESIGIDETSYKKGHKYMTVVVDHKTGHLIWAKKGHGKETLSEFFKEMTEEQRAKIKHVTADGARWIADCISDYCPNAERCIDPFHVVAWANSCLDEVRKAIARQAKQEAAEGKKAEYSKKKRTPKPRSIPC